MALGLPAGSLHMGGEQQDEEATQPHTEGL